MKISGTGQPPNPGVSGADGSDPAGKVDAGAGAGSDKVADKRDVPGTGQAFAEKLAGGSPVVAARQTPKTVSATPASAVAIDDVAAELRSGKLTPQAAIDRVVERVVAQQAGPNAPAAVRDQLRAALQDALADDPTLIAKVSQLQS